jgi:hypothetical protein
MVKFIGWINVLTSSIVTQINRLFQRLEIGIGKGEILMKASAGCQLDHNAPQGFVLMVFLNFGFDN